MLEHEVVLKLVNEAKKVMKYSYAPYSDFNVGAALLTAEGKIYTGCNIENAALTPGNCAERTAFFKAISEGKKRFLAIAVVGGKKGVISDFCPPCGVCRQVMREFCEDDFVIILCNKEGHIQSITLGELLPKSFGPDQL